MAKATIYECGICGSYHPWNWNGDCRDDANRFGDPEEFAEKMGLKPIDVDVKMMEDRVVADQLDEFTHAYIECALWLTDENPGSGEWQGFSEFFPKLAPETLARMIADCAKFRDDAKIVACIRDREKRAGHDFWLTRNEHGCGFWDGDWPEPDATFLNRRAKQFGTVDLYFGDDGQIYSM